MIFGVVLQLWTIVSAIDHILVPDLPAELNTQYKYFLLTISIQSLSESTKQRIVNEGRTALTRLNYGIPQVIFFSSGSLFQLRVGFPWQQLYMSNVDKDKLLDELRNIDFSDATLIDIEGEALCPDSYCILGENTICQEDLDDFRPVCVSPCKLPNYCSSAARCLHTDEQYAPRCFCLGAISSVTFGSRCQYSLPLVAILGIAAFVICIISFCAAICFRQKYGQKISSPNDTEFRSEVDDFGQASVSIQPTNSLWIVEWIGTRKLPFSTTFPNDQTSNLIYYSINGTIDKSRAFHAE